MSGDPPDDHDALFPLRDAVPVPRYRFDPPHPFAWETRPDYLTRVERAAVKQLRAYLWMVQRGRCRYCRRLLTRSHLNDRPTDGTLDHQVPASEGGPTDPANCVLACRACNQLKGALSVTEFALLRVLYRRYWPSRIKQLDDFLP